ncbi:MAG TPA: pilus assembly protein TadG-related protein [Acidobacteriaceae bacterium]|nr:pilus assembly protein TadG-related protein [Acidobacteriaceae bacterium]
MKILRDEHGQMLILTVLSMTVLLGVLAFATDLGVLFRAKRNLQIAADAAATAGAIDLRYGSSTSTALNDSVCAAYANGYKATNVTPNCSNTVPSNSSNATVAINTPPVYGYHRATGFVEAIVTAPNPTFFMNLFGYHSMNVSARAVAGTVNPSDNCIYLLNPAGTGLTVRGSSSVTATFGSKACGIYVNSSSSSAVDTTGQGNNINTGYVDVNGGTTGSGTLQNTTVNSNLGAMVPDPYKTQVLKALDNMPACTSSNTFTGTTLSITQAQSIVSTGGMNGGLSGGTTPVYCFGNTAGTPVTLQDGVSLTGGTYIFQNGVAIASGATVTFGTGTPGSTVPQTNAATLDVANNYFYQPSNTTLNVFAPNYGPLNSIGLLVPGNSQNASTCMSGYSYESYSYTATYPNTTSPYYGNHNYGDCINGTQSCQQMLAGSTSYKTALQVQFGSSAGSVFDGVVYAPTAALLLHDSGNTVSPNTYSGIIAGQLCEMSSHLILPSYNAENPYTTPLRVVALVE